jgi:hypothetical protein
LRLRISRKAVYGTGFSHLKTAGAPGSSAMPLS